MRSLVAAVSLAVITCLPFDVAHAEGVVVSDGWVRASIGAASNSAAYMKLTTEGETGDRLIAVETPVAQRAELHNHIMEDGIARMRAVDVIDVGPEEPVTLEPGGLHIMLMGLKEKLELGATLPLTLSFEKAGDMDVDLPIQPIDYRPN